MPATFVNLRRAQFCGGHSAGRWTGVRSGWAHSAPFVVSLIIALIGMAIGAHALLPHVSSVGKSSDSAVCFLASSARFWPSPSEVGSRAGSQGIGGQNPPCFMAPLHGS
jgi:hypothetical protein